MNEHDYLEFTLCFCLSSQVQSTRLFSGAGRFVLLLNRLIDYFLASEIKETQILS